MPLSLIRRYSVYFAVRDGWAQMPDGWAQIIDDWAQARSGPPLATPLLLAGYFRCGHGWFADHFHHREIL